MVVHHYCMCTISNTIMNLACEIVTSHDWAYGITFNTLHIIDLYIVRSLLFSASAKIAPCNQASQPVTERSVTTIVMYFLHVITAQTQAIC